MAFGIWRSAPGHQLALDSELRIQNCIGDDPRMPEFEWNCRVQCRITLCVFLACPAAVTCQPPLSLSPPPRAQLHRAAEGAARRRLCAQALVQLHCRVGAARLRPGRGRRLRGGGGSRGREQARAQCQFFQLRRRAAQRRQARQRPLRDSRVCASSRGCSNSSLTALIVALFAIRGSVRSSTLDTTL